MAYTKGYIRDAAHKRTQKDARLHPALAAHLAAGLPAAFSLEQFEAPTMDQGGTSACTGHGTAQGVYMAFAAAGVPLPWVPSPRGIYGLGRVIGRVPNADGTLPLLTDNGAQPADVMAGISWGIRAIQAPTSDGRYSDCEPANVNSEPTVAELQLDGEEIVTGEYRIDETSSTVIDQVCAALIAGAPVGVGGYVDPAFENWAPGAPPIPAPDTNAPGGGHWIVIVSYRTDPTGHRIFRIKNSWSDNWGDHGHADVSEAWVKALWDIYPLAVAKKVAA